jgi:hypothetical protein
VEETEGGSVVSVLPLRLACSLASCAMCGKRGGMFSKKEKGLSSCFLRLR